MKKLLILAQATPLRQRRSPRSHFSGITFGIRSPMYGGRRNLSVDSLIGLALEDRRSHHRDQLQRVHIEWIILGYENEPDRPAAICNREEMGTQGGRFSTQSYPDLARRSQSDHGIAG